MFPLRDDRPTYTAPVVTTLLIVACALVFFFELSLDEYSRDYFINRYGLVPAHMRPVTLLTSLFIHGGWSHIIGNMLFLWIYGNNVEHAMGHLRYLVFYLLCGVAALFAQALADPHSAYPIIGASGAISGVLGAYLMLFPRAKVLTLVLLPFFVTTLRVPAMLLLLVWFAAQLLSEAAVAGGDAGVAFRAHIGGFVAGILLATVLKRREVHLFAR